MKKQSVLCLTALAAITAATFFAVRQRTLNELRSGNESFRQQMETPGNGAGSEAVAETAATNSAALSAEEKAELLRLRGQVPSLRDEASEASNRVASLSRPRTAEAAAPRRLSLEEQRSRDLIQEFTRSESYQSANEVAKAVQKYLQQHGGQIPEDLAVVSAPGNYSFANDGALKRFELIRTGVITDNPDMAPFLLIAREKESIQLPDGKWVRLYLQANGGVTIAGPLPNKPPSDDSGLIRQQEEMGKRRIQSKQAESRP